MNSDKEPCLDRERKECDVQLLPTEQILRDVETLTDQFDSDFRRLAQ